MEAIGACWSRDGMKNEDRGKEMGKATVKRQENDMSEWPNGPFISKKKKFHNNIYKLYSKIISTTHLKKKSSNKTNIIIIQ